MSIANDEPVYEDKLGHHPLARRVGHRVLKCDPPYVLGVCGSWGSGKTSFLRKVWVYLNGQAEWSDDKTRPIDTTKREEWFGESAKTFSDLTQKKNLELIWFNPWQHQFEASPLVALLNEIRQHFTIKKRLFDKAGKLADVAIHATLNSLTEIAKDLKLPLPSAKTVMERGREYESEHFSTPLTSQRFRDFFEQAIKIVTGEKGLLVIFIDDLDRCEGDVAYRLLESLKLYLNVKNCVFILGLDQQHLERTIGKALSGEKETGTPRLLARDYLSKMLQGTFHLPVPRQAKPYLEYLLKPDDADFKQRAAELFGITDAEFLSFRKKLVTALDQNLPHNPRRIKAFVNSWRLYLDALPDPPGKDLDWRLTLILQYLAQFEEPLFRKIEQAPAFYSNEFVAFCRSGYSAHPLFEGLDRPYEMAQVSQADDKKGGLEDPTPTTIATTAASSDAPKRLPEPRVFWISRLVLEVVNEYGASLNEQTILRHLLHTHEAQ